MATPDRQRYALQTIFSFFLGLMVLAFIGVGVNTFYPSPAEQAMLKQQAVQRQLDAAQNKALPGSFTATQQAEVTRLQRELDTLNNRQMELEKDWAKTTSIILVVFATIVMAISLIRSEQLRVLSTGLLLGGLFTMLYGTGWVIFSGNSAARFAVITFALLVSIALGYVKFVRERAQGPAEAPASTGTDSLSDIEARLAALEERASAAAAALSGTEPPGKG